METASRVATWLVIASVATILVTGSGSAPLTDPDEARLARTSAEMLGNGDLVVPTFEAAPRPGGPPLFHWMQVAFFRALGLGEFSARLPAILATLGSLLLVAFVARRRFGEEGAAWAAAAFGTMPLVVVAGKVGTLESLFALHVFAAVALDMAEPGEAGRYRGAAIGALVGLAFLAKGPVGIVFPVLLLVAGRTASGRNVIPGASAAAAVAGFSVAVLPWGLAFLERFGLAGSVWTMGREAVAQYTAGSGHDEPTWFHAKVLLAACAPWVAPLLLGFVRLIGRRSDPASKTALYAAGALLTGLIVFSLGSGKRPEDILPLLPFAAIVITWELGQELSRERESRLGPGLVVATLACLAFGLAWIGSLLAGRGAEGLAAAGAAVFGLGAFSALAGVTLQRVRWVYGTAVVASIVFLSAAAFGLYPILARERSAEPTLLAVPDLFSSRPVVVLEADVPSLTFYLDRVPEKVDRTRLAERLARRDSPLVIVDEERTPSLDPVEQSWLRVIGGTGRYTVYETRDPRNTPFVRLSRRG